MENKIICNCKKVYVADIEKALQASWIDEMAASELCCEMEVPF